MYILPIKQRGAGLIEVLVTTLIVGIGMLAIVHMQIISMQSNHEAFQRSLAVQLANGIVERIRSVSVFEIGPYNNVVVGGGSIGAEPSPNCTSTIETCSIAEKISYDLWEWEQELDGANELSSNNTNSGGLNNANGCIQVNNNHIEVIIAWDGVSSAVKSTHVTAANNCGNLNATNLERRRQIKIQTVI